MLCKGLARSVHAGRAWLQPGWRALATTALACEASQDASPVPEVYDSVVKIYSTSLRPNHWQPWQLRGQSESSGSGFAVSPSLILTNAHVVADNAFATVKRQGSSERFKCEVKAVAHECDLALLAVEDPRFWREPTPMQPLELGDVPQLQEEVTVVGYPQGGSNVCVTAGVVSRVGMTPYAHAGTKLLAVQIDAAINPGNSGGPALQNDKVVGVAFQDLEESSNIGYIIPTPVVRLFLSEVERRGEFRGISSLGVRCQPLENPAARRALGMRPEQNGVLVVSVLPLGAAAGHIPAGDVLMSFNGTPIANDGTILFRQHERVSFDHLVTLTVPGAAATLRVLRGGRELECTVRPRVLEAPVPQHMHNTRPSYLIYGGLVFTPLTQPFLHEWGEEEGQNDWQSKCPQNLYHLSMNAEARAPGEQVIVLSQVLADEVTFGYSRLENLQLLEVDGVRVHNMAHLVQLLEQGPEEDGDGGSGSSDSSSSESSESSSSSEQQQAERSRYVRFTLERNQLVILDRREAEAALPRILETHRIPAARSADLLPAAGGQAAAAGAA